VVVGFIFDGGSAASCAGLGPPPGLLRHHKFVLRIDERPVKPLPLVLLPTLVQRSARLNVRIFRPGNEVDDKKFAQKKRLLRNAYSLLFASLIPFLLSELFSVVSTCISIVMLLCSSIMES
jgi:hypothetical protein